MTHQVLIGITQKVITLSPVGAEIKTFENSDKLGEAILHLLAGTQLILIVEVGLINDSF